MDLARTHARTHAREGFVVLTACWFARGRRSAVLTACFLLSGCAGSPSAELRKSRQPLVAPDGGAVAAEPTPAESERVARIAETLAAPSRTCMCTTDKPCALPCEANGTCEPLLLPLLPPSTCAATPIMRVKERLQRILISACGYVGVRESSMSPETGEFRSEERWYETSSLRMVGRAAASAGMDKATAAFVGSQPICEGTLPAAACEVKACETCVPPSKATGFRNGCGLEHVGLAKGAP